MGFAPPFDATEGAGATKVVLAHGCYDLLHLGHIRHLREAKQLGDYLIVSITADKFVNKGHGRPHFSAEQRREALKSLEFVDEVVINEALNAVDTIKRVRPAIYVKGSDYADVEDENLALERAAVEAHGGRIVFTTSEKWSSTKLLRDVKLSDEALAYLERARAAGFYDKIMDAFDRADKLKILFVGEFIMDEYRYVQPLSKPSKEFILATVAAGGESFEGGIIAASKHGGWELADYFMARDFVTKTRYVEADFSRKLFEVYSKKQIEPLLDEELTTLKRRVDDADMVVVIDFGHGMMNPREQEIVLGARFLALTAQTNAANHGFNLVTRYKRADYVCVDEPECRLAAGHQGGTADQAMFRVMQRMRPANMTVTRGRYGSISRKAGAKHFASVPAFIESGYDTMGAGDCFLAVAAPLVAAGLEVEMAAFAGNVAGGLKTAILGHRRHVGRDDIVQNMEWLLK